MFVLNGTSFDDNLESPCPGLTYIPLAFSYLTY